MTLDRYLLFVAGSVLLVVTPGPDMAFFVSRAVAQGRRAGLLAVLGINAGAYCHLAAAVLGLSALLAASPRAFTVVTWLGAAYLAWIGVGALRSRGGTVAMREDAAPIPERQLFWQGFLSDVLNPKVGMFYLAFLPQFTSGDPARRTRELVLLGLTVNVIALVLNTGIVLAAARVSRRLRSDERTGRRLTQLMGVVFILLGLRIALE